MNLRVAIAFVLLFLAASPGWSQTAYVTDQLRLGVHAAEDTSDRAFTNLSSGDAVQILQREGAYARVRLADGREGWVRATFLVDEPPARAQLPGLTAERDRLRAELDAVTGEQDARASTLASLQASVAAADARVAASEARAQALESRRAALAGQVERQAAGLPRWTVVAGTGIGVTAGVLIGWLWFDWRSRRRHGGFRIY